MENTKEFNLNDFYQAAILKSAGFPLLRLERNSGKFVTFVFGDPKCKAKETIRRYWDRTLKLTARDLVETINELKTRIYSGV